MTFNPDWISPPCDTIDEFLEELGGYQELSEAIGASELRLLRGNRKRITEPIAEALSRHLGSSTQFWLNRQRNYEHDAFTCGDILKIVKGVIGHQVNCQGKMGAGLARKIAQRYPAALRSYVNHLKVTGPEQALGGFVGKKVTADLAVVHLFYLGSSTTGVMVAATPTTRHFGGSLTGSVRGACSSTYPLGWVAGWAVATGVSFRKSSRVLM